MGVDRAKVINNHAVRSLENRLLGIGVGALLLVASFSKIYWHTHSPPQFHVGWFDTPSFLFPASTFELCLGSVLLAGSWSPGIKWVSICTFGVFAGVALAEVIGGSKNCGCFGGGAHIPPGAMAVFDSLCVILLLLCNAKVCNGSKIFGVGKVGIAFVLTMLTAGIATAAVWATHRPHVLVAQSGQIQSDADPFGTPGTLVLLDAEKLVGKPFLLATHIDIRSQLRTGRWIVLLAHDDCDVCAGAVPKYQAASSTTDAPKLAIIEMPPYGSPSEAAPWPTSIGLFGKLDTTRDWFATTPLAILLNDGNVQAATDGERAATPDRAWFSSPSR